MVGANVLRLIGRKVVRIDLDFERKQFQKGKWSFTRADSWHKDSDKYPAWWFGLHRKPSVSPRALLAMVAIVIVKNIEQNNIHVG